MTFEEELLQILNQIPVVIEKAFTAFVERHPGHASQKPHGRRYGAGGEVLPKGHKRGEAVKGKAGGGADTDPGTWNQRLSTKEKSALRDYPYGCGRARVS